MANTSARKKASNLIVKFKGCESGPFTCTSAGHEKGELETKPLEGKLVWENEKTKKVAFELFPEKGETFIEFNCEGKLSVAVKGAILVPVKTDTMASTFTLKYKAKHGFQVPEFYEEGGVKVKAALFCGLRRKRLRTSRAERDLTVTNEETLEIEHGRLTDAAAVRRAFGSSAPPCRACDRLGERSVRGMV